MEKIQLLERSSGSLQPTGHHQDMDPETTPAPGSATTAWCSPPHPKLPANSRPLRYRQETGFHLRAGGVSEESTRSSAGAGHPPRHSLSLTLPAAAQRAVVQLSCASRLPAIALAQKEVVNVVLGDHCVPYCCGRLPATQQQLQRYQASRLSPHLQYHWDWAIQRPCSQSH